MANKKISLALKITGKVQGVGFRAFTRDIAHANEISGWVRNEPDGSVSALISGPHESVDRTLEALRTGPPFGQVDHIETHEAYAPSEGFSILH